MDINNNALIIDDDPDICFMLGEVFKKKNFSVNSAYNLHEAKIAVNIYNPSIIVLDNTLPDGRGVDFIFYIEQNCPESKIILITGDYDTNDDEYTANGHAKFIRKPFTLDKFRSVLETLS